MSLVKTALAELGGTESHNGEVRAHIQCRDDSGRKVNVRGPSRTTEEQAQKDLERIRKAGTEGNTRDEGLEKMRDEANQLKESAHYEAEIRETLHRRDSMMESDYEDYEEDDRSDDSEPPWMMESTKFEEPELIPIRSVSTPLEATAELSKFRPIRATPADLKYLLENRADPNMPLNSGDISPLQKVMTFASEKHVAEMRELLLQIGANESPACRPATG